MTEPDSAHDIKRDAPRSTRKPWRPWLGLLIGLLPSGLLGVSVIGIELLSGPIPSHFVSEIVLMPVQLSLLVGTLASIVVGLFALPLMVFKRTRRGAGTMLVASLAFVLVCYGTQSFQHHRRMEFYRGEGERLDHFVDLISQFEIDHGRPPEVLDELIPRYTEALPRPGPESYFEFRYRIIDARDVSSGSSYELGRFPGEGILRRILDEAALDVFTDANGIVTNAYVRNVPKDVSRIPFDADQWLAHERRAEMAHALIEATDFVGQPIEEVEARLGPADSSWFNEATDATWELSVDASRGLLNWDELIYRPRQDYDISPITRLGRWAYFHE